ncbi:MAG TPA: hypothetical protein VF618_27835 [Thermoanaerobaculia bacterium]
MAIGIEPREIEVRTTWQVIVTSYQWLIHDTGVGPRQPAFGYQSGTRWVAKAQNTPEYGRYMAQLAKTYGIRMFSSYWTYEHNGLVMPLRNFNSSIGSLPMTELGPIRFIYMFDLVQFPLRWSRLQNAIIERKAEILGPKYTRLRDSRGVLRPIIMFWGDQANQAPAAFQTMIDNVRKAFAPVEPYFITTQHGINSNDDRLIRSVDAFYEHSLYHNYNAQASPTAGPRPATLDTKTSTDLTVERIWKPHRAALQGKTNFHTGLPVMLMPGAMPQLELHDQRRGFVQARNKADVEYMFAKSKQYAPVVSARRTDGVIELERWIVLTDFNEWVEGHTIEPCRRVPPEQSETEPYNANHEYGDDFMEAFRDAYRPEVRRRIFPTADDPQI